MTANVTLDAVYALSDDVVARNIEGEIIIVPLVSSIGGIDDALYTLNETGQAIWERLDGQRSLRDVIANLADEFEAADGVIEADVLGLVKELVKRKILVEA
jgi:hypothetical protein